MLTYKATIDRLENQGIIVRYGFDPDDPSPALRQIYISAHFLDWMEKKKLQMRRSQNAPSSAPFYQVIERFDSFCSGEPFELNRMYKLLSPQNQAVWEIKSPEVRVFGCFIAVDVFVAISGELKNALRSTETYKTHIHDVMKFCKKHGLIRIQGDKTRDVISIKN